MSSYKFSSMSIFRLFRYNLMNKFIFCRSVAQDKSNPLKVHVFPALTDNYMYLLIDTVKKIGIAVDPVEPDKILHCLKEKDITLKAVLTTHHHFDHAGGNALLCRKIKNIPIYGGDDRIEALSVKLTHNEIFKISDIDIKCLHTPCHTSGHVCYFIDSNDPICFTGDTLFIAGCGKFFEGSAEQMYKSLDVLCKLPLKTKLYCGHEYTVNNLKFALHVDPYNNAAMKRLNQAMQSLEMMQPTVPSTLEDELSFNPFLRAQTNAVQNFTGQTDPVAAIKILRDIKDNFKKEKIDT